MRAEDRGAPAARVPPSGPHTRRWLAYAGLWVTLAGLGVAVWESRSGGVEPPKGQLEKAGSVMIKNFEFTPSTLTIARGGIVQWTNADVANHQISSGVVDGNQPRPDGRVSSPLLFRGDAFTATFTAPGEYPYYCGVHPFMRGTIVAK